MTIHRSSRIGLLLLAVLVIALLLTVFFSQQGQQTQQHAAGNTTIVTIDLSNLIGTSQFVTGASHTQDDITLYGSRTSARQVISSALVFENVPIMGWGSPDPEPSPGTYDWSVLDSRIQFMRSTGTTKMITLCCAPAWMRDPQYASDDWTYLAARPAISHFQDYANLAKRVAQRYPDVQYFQVWNELKGFYIPPPTNHWDYVNYTLMYNMIYDAIKSVRPDAKIGGPYVPLDIWADPSAGGWPAKDPTLYNQPWGTVDQRSLDAITYWLANKHGGDFIVFDGGTGTREGTWTTDEFSAFDFYQPLLNWIRKQPNGGATLPIGSAEWYPHTPQTYTDINPYNAVFAHGLITMITSGYWYALPWGTQGDSQGLNADPASFMTNRGQPTAEYYTLKALKDYFSQGTQLYKVIASSNTVTVLASKAKTMLVNHLRINQIVIVNGTTINLTPYQVTVVDTPG